MRIVFMGTPDFARVSLQALVEADLRPVAVVTQPDKPKGRGYTLTPPPVKVYAEEQGIPVYQPATLKDGAFDPTLDELNPDLIVVVAYGKILPLSVLERPPHGCINVHGSLLPAYRGAAPMQRAIMDGCAETGVTTMYMAQGLDTGDMLLTGKIAIEDHDNFETIHDKLADCGADVLLHTIAAIKAGNLPRTPQNEAEATYAAKIEKADCLIDFSKDARTVHNQIRGLSPIPLSFTHTPNGKLLKVTEARVGGLPTSGFPGQVLAADNDGITVACGTGSVTLLRVVPEGKKPMAAADFVRGRQCVVGDVLA